jgi:small-conductance mechanosensitive channel
MLCSDYKFLHRLLLLEALDKANERADALAIKLEQSEKAREKAEQDAASVEDLRKRLHHAENALSDKVTLFSKLLLESALCVF